MRRFLYRSYYWFYTVGQWRKQHFTRAGLMVLITLPVTAGLGLNITQSTIYQLFALLVPFLILSIVWSMFFRARLTIERKLPHMVTCGRPFSYQVIITNKSSRTQQDLRFFENLKDPRPSFSAFTTEPEPGEQRRNIWDRNVLFHRWMWLLSRNRQAIIPKTVIPALPPGAAVPVTVQVTPIRRGYLRFQSISLAEPDPLGLFQSIRTIPLEQAVLVLPKRYQLPAFALEGQRHYQPGGISLASSVGNADEFISLRAYRPGDPMKQIHWKSWAKTGELIIREYQDEYFTRQALILDTFTGSRFDERFEEAVSIAASLVSGLSPHESLLDLMMIGEQAYHFSAGRGISQISSMLEVLACVQPCTNKPVKTLSGLIQQNISRLSGCIFVLLDWDPKRQAMIEPVVQQKIPVKVIVVTDREPNQQSFHPGPLVQQRQNFHVVQTGKIEEGFSAL